MNSGGLLAGPGLRLKQAKVETLRPDLLLLLGAHPVLDALVKAYPELCSLRLAPSPQARGKGEGERRRARRDAFRAYFAAARTWTAPRPNLLPEAGAAPALQPGLLVGLADGAGRDVGLGVVAALDAAAGSVTFLTPVPRDEAVRLRAGALILDADFRERRAATRSP